MKFEIYHYLAVISAYYIHEPDNIYIYVDIEPVNNLYWDIIKNYVEIRYVHKFNTFRDVDIIYPQYVADILRLQILIKHGGIYLDIDNLSIKKFDMLDKKFVMGASTLLDWEIDGEFYNVDVFDESNIDNIEAMSNSIIMSEPHNPFLIKWYDCIHQYMSEDFSWAYHAVCLPRILLLENKNFIKDMTIMRWCKFFCPVDIDSHNPFIFGNDIYQIFKLKDYYTIVFYQTLVNDIYLNKINVKSILFGDNIFSFLFKKYVIEMLESKCEMLKIMWKLYNNNNYEELKNICEGIILLMKYVNDNDNNDEFKITMYYLGYANVKLKNYEIGIKILNKLLKLNISDDIKIWVNNLMKYIDLNNKIK